MSVNQRWALKLVPPLHSKQWESAQFIYDPASGQTHYLNSTCGEVLSLLAEQPLSSDALYRQILANHASAEDPKFQDALSDIMLLLEQLGVVQSVP